MGFFDDDPFDDIVREFFGGSPVRGRKRQNVIKNEEDDRVIDFIEERDKVYLIFELLRKLFGGSLGFEELVIGLLIANLGYSFYINAQLSEHLGWHKGKGGSS